MKELNYNVNTIDSYQVTNLNMGYCESSISVLYSRYKVILCCKGRDVILKNTKKGKLGYSEEAQELNMKF